MANYKNILIGIIGGMATATVAKIIEDDYTRKFSRQREREFLVNAAMIDILREHDERLDQETPSRKYHSNPTSKMKQDYKPNNRKEDNHE
mgnify:CR=1 FL=1